MSLPTWNLNDLYAGPTDPKIEQDLNALKNEVIVFAHTYEDKLASLSADGFLKAICALENMEERIGRIGSFAYLYFSQDMLNPTAGQFYQSMQEKISEISKNLVFLSLEINALGQSQLDQWFAAAPALEKYRHWIESIRVFKDHQLSKEVEKVLHEKSLTSQQAWVRLFDETFANMHFMMNGEVLDTSTLLDKTTHSDEAVRKEATYIFAQGLEDRAPLFTLITNTLAKNKQMEDEWRDYKNPMQERHLANHVEEEVVNALISSVKEAYPRLSHRYYALKARWFGGEKLAYWNRNAPLPHTDDTPYSWDEAKDIVLNSYRRFSPKMGEIGQVFFERKWIDASPRKGKDSGAYSHSTVPSVHPYILMNYHGKARDIMILAHELGHGVHQVLSSKQGLFGASTPLTLAETASVFGEMLTFHELLRQSAPAQRKFLLASKVEDMINTVVRQVAFYEFEKLVHEQRKFGELSAEQLGQFWMQTQQESLGAALEFDDHYACFWSYIPHFIHSPFYVYAYAFGLCLVNSLYKTYETHPDGFVEKYLELLSSGGTKHHRELLAPFGLDARDPNFWKQGLTLIDEMITELETL